MNMLWGFGAVKFEYDFGSGSKTFDNAVGTLSVIHEKTVRVSKTGKKIIKSWGFRPVITVRLWNLNKGMNNANQLSGLMNILNNTKTKGVMIYPRLGGVGSDVGYLCELTSDLSPQDISTNVPAGQYIDLSFEGMELLPSIPTFVSNPALSNIVVSIGGTQYNLKTTGGDNVIAANRSL